MAWLDPACRRTASPPGTAFSAERTRLREALGERGRPPAGPRLVGGLTLAPRAFRGDAVAAMRAIQRRAESETSAESLADLGVVQALLGRSREAAASLGHAARLAPRDPRIISDLAALYLREAATGEWPVRIEALDTVDRALALAPDLPEARANLGPALALSFLVEPPTARANQRRAPTSGTGRSPAPSPADSAPQSWPAAQAQLEACAQPCGAARAGVVRFPREARKYAEDRLLPRWAGEVVRGQESAAAQTLDSIARIGAAARDCCGESMLAEAAAELRRAGPATAQRLARGVRRAAEGLKMCQANEGARGMSKLAAAARALAVGPPALRAWAEYGRGLCAYQSARLFEAVAIFGALERRLGERYPSLRSRALWVRCASLGRLGRQAECLGDCHAAHELAERVGAPAERAGVDFNLHEALWLIGQRPAAWRWLFEGTALAVESRDPRRLTVAYAELYRVARETGFAHAALRFADRLVELSTADLGRAGLAYALYTRAAARFELGRKGAALQDLAAAERAAAGIADRRSRLQWQADVWSERGRQLRDTGAAAAASELERAVAAAEELHDSARAVPFRVDLSRAQSALHHPEAAAKSLQRALAELERQRRSLTAGADRADLLAQSRTVYDQRMAIALQAHEAPAAIFEIAEQARARALGDDLERPPVGAEIARRLPRDQALVEFAVLQHHLLTWVLRGGQVSLHTQPVEADDLEAWTRSVRGEADESRRVDAMRRLSKLIVEPIAGEIAGASTLFISPDQCLRRVPFAALAAAAGRPLVEAHTLIIVPSAALADLPGAARRPMPGTDALVLGDPRLDTRTFDFLPPLPGAREEARQIAALYGRGAELLVGQAATASALLRGFGQFPVVHLAAHVLASDEHPDLAAVPLAQAAPGDRMALTAADVRRLHAGRTRLVVLASCRAAGSEDREGSRGLVEAFLAAGVPEVVAALWDVDDQVAQVFFARFHRRLLAGDSPPEALRAVQLALLHASDPNLNNPVAWGGYEAFQVAAPAARRN